MSVKKQVPSLCKIYSFYEEITEEFLDESDVDSYFYSNIFDISQSQHRLVQVCRGSNKKSFAIKLCHFCDSKRQQRYILQKVVIISKTELTCLVDSLRDFLKNLIKLASAYRFPYRSPQLRMDLQSQKTISLFFTIAISLNIQKVEFLYRSNLERTIHAYFQSKSLNYTVINFFFQKLELNHREIHLFYKNRYYVANKCEIIECN